MAFTHLYVWKSQWKLDIGGLVQDFSNSSALAMELLQHCAKPSISVGNILADI